MLSPQDVSARRRAFRQLHQSGCFVIPNPWDIGSARYLQGLGFKALATTSSGAAWRHAKADGQLSVEETLVHLREMVAATELPVNADFEHGFAWDAAGVARNVRLAVDTGVAGLSIEDSTGDASEPLRDIAAAARRIQAARAAIDETGGETLLVGRAENFIVGRPDLHDAIRRLQAYAEAGADCLYAPGIKTREQIAAVVAAVAAYYAIRSAARRSWQPLAGPLLRSVWRPCVAPWYPATEPGLDGKREHAGSKSCC